MHFDTTFSSISFTFSDHIFHHFVNSFQHFSLFIVVGQAAGGVRATVGHQAGGGGVQGAAGGMLAGSGLEAAGGVRAARGHQAGGGGVQAAA